VQHTTVPRSLVDVSRLHDAVDLVNDCHQGFLLVKVVQHPSLGLFKIFFK
jgi:hypothetical protein